MDYKTLQNQEAKTKAEIEKLQKKAEKIQIKIGPMQSQLELVQNEIYQIEQVHQAIKANKTQLLCNKAVKYVRSRWDRTREDRSCLLEFLDKNFTKQQIRKAVFLDNNRYTYNACPHSITKLVYAIVVMKGGTGNKEIEKTMKELNFFHGNGTIGVTLQNLVAKGWIKRIAHGHYEESILHTAKNVNWLARIITYIQKRPFDCLPIDNY